MVLIESYPVAVTMCIITMLCWGSWANTQKLASREWKFQLFYWDYAIGVLLLTLILAFTMGSMGMGEGGRSFIADLKQASGKMILYAFIGGVIFNFANILLVAAIDIAGMAVAFPVGIGIALVQGVVINYIGTPEGNPFVLFTGVALVAVAIVIDAIAYKRLQSGSAERQGILKGLVLSVVAGVTMGLFYRFVAKSMVPDFTAPGAFINPLNAGALTPYSALVVFALGLLLSCAVFVTVIMFKPFSGERVSPSDYFNKGTPRLHLIGIVGGAIWSLGMSFSIIASGAAGPAISYGLGQGATMIAAFWGVYIWKEFKDAPQGTSKMLNAMFGCFIIGLALIIAARVI